MDNAFVMETLMCLRANCLTSQLQPTLFVHPLAIFLRGTLISSTCRLLYCCLLYCRMIWLEAAQQEVAERRSHRKHRDKLHKAKQQEAASVAQDILQVPAGFAQFTARILQLYKQHGIEWPTVTLEFKHMNVTTKVWG